jgi:hypothetical protein
MGILREVFAEPIDYDEGDEHIHIDMMLDEAIEPTLTIEDLLRERQAKTPDQPTQPEGER